MRHAILLQIHNLQSLFSTMVPKKQKLSIHYTVPKNVISKIYLTRD